MTSNSQNNPLPSRLSDCVTLKINDFMPLVKHLLIRFTVHSTLNDLQCIHPQNDGCHAPKRRSEARPHGRGGSWGTVDGHDNKRGLQVWMADVQIYMVLGMVLMCGGGCVCILKCRMRALNAGLSRHLGTRLWWPSVDSNRCLSASTALTATSHHCPQPRPLHLRPRSRPPECLPLLG